MKIKQLAKLLEENKHKIEVIDKITELHPGFGTELGWSHYTGGMVDDGDWNLDVLLEVPLYRLEAHLTIWLKAVHDSKVQSEETAKEIERHRKAGTLDEYDRKVQEKVKKEFKEWKEKMDRALMWGESTQRDVKEI